MATAETSKLEALYEQDETAWLEAMSSLAADGRYTDMDFANLSEYLLDMARRDRREVFSRLVVLLAHLLKWDLQPDRRGGSWRATIMEQRRELRMLLESGTLHNHAETVIANAWKEARRQVEAETEMPLEAIPAQNPWNLDSMLSEPAR